MDDFSILLWNELDKLRHVDTFSSGTSLSFSVWSQVHRRAGIPGAGALDISSDTKTWCVTLSCRVKLPNVLELSPEQRRQFPEIRIFYETNSELLRTDNCVTMRDEGNRMSKIVCSLISCILMPAHIFLGFELPVNYHYIFRHFSNCVFMNGIIIKNRSSICAFQKNISWR